MKNYIQQLAVSLVVSLFALSAIASATTADIKLGQKVLSELVTMPYYGIFDNLAFGVKDAKVTLFGQVHWPNLKNEVERIVAGIKGVTSVDNQIEVLPNSFFDDSIRVAVAQAIFSHPVLERYTLKAVPSIHIIVKNGNVTLEGFVSRDMHKSVANLRANTVSGVLSVTNNLHVENPKKKI